jgi:aquaporin Z
MIAVGLFVTAFESPKSLAYTGTTSPGLRIVLLATAVGITLTLLIQSPWGKRSGAHMNPAITVAFLRLRKMHRGDALFYILAQTTGGILGISVVAYLVGSPFTDPLSLQNENVLFVQSRNVRFHRWPRAPWKRSESL